MKINKFEFYRNLKASTYLKMMQYNIIDKQVVDMLDKSGIGLDNFTYIDIDEMVDFMIFIEKQDTKTIYRNDLKLYVVFSNTYFDRYFTILDTVMYELFVDKNSELYVLIGDKIKHKLSKVYESEYTIKDFKGNQYSYNQAVEILRGEQK